MNSLLLNGTTHANLILNESMKDPIFFQFDIKNYSFIKNESSNSYFDLPVIEILGAKKRIENNEFDTFDDVFNE